MFCYSLTSHIVDSTHPVIWLAVTIPQLWWRRWTTWRRAWVWSWRTSTPSSANWRIWRRARCQGKKQQFKWSRISISGCLCYLCPHECLSHAPLRCRRQTMAESLFTALGINPSELGEGKQPAAAPPADDLPEKLSAQPPPADEWLTPLLLHVHEIYIQDENISVPHVKWKTIHEYAVKWIPVCSHFVKTRTKL